MVDRWDLSRYGIDGIEVIITQDESIVDVKIESKHSSEGESRKWEAISSYVISDMERETSRFLSKPVSPNLFHYIVMEIVNKIKEAEEKWIRGKI